MNKYITLVIFLIPQYIPAMEESRNFKPSEINCLFMCSDPNVYKTPKGGAPILGEIEAHGEDYDTALERHLEQFKSNPSNLETTKKLLCILGALGKVATVRDVYSAIPEAYREDRYILYTLAYALKTEGKMSEAIKVLEKIYYKNPEDPVASANLGFAYLANGNFEQGWPLYLKEKKHSSLLREWLMNGVSLEGKKISIDATNVGIGDVLHFIGFVHELKQRGAFVRFISPRSMKTIISRCTNFIDVVQLKKEEDPIEYDAETPIMTLPALFNVTEKTISRDGPYINPDNELVKKWRKKLAHDHNLKIGFILNASLYNDEFRPLIERRTVPLEKFLELGKIKGISLYSLQQKPELPLDRFELISCNNGIETYVLKGSPEVQFHIFDDAFDKESGPFMDSAAVMKNLDIVIAPPTASAHLAGEVGVETFLILKKVTDWRWPVNKETPTWYPHAKLFKEKRPFDLDSVFERIKAEIEKKLT